ncbi:MAG: glycosyltransferase [Candidatus Hatepunaea meridiana]|nr:glycosyltransferase [Candidatus Hatepunaea meridiana]
MKILYVAPENVTGGFNLFAEGHRKRGNECRWITFFHNQFGFEEDLCLDLWGMPITDWVHKLRSFLNRIQSAPDLPELNGNPPVWRPNSVMEAILYRVRDIKNNSRIKRAISKWNLNDFDIYHFEQGIDLFRSGHWIKELQKRGKGIVAFYHGTDLRNRGVIPAVHSAAVLNLTSEIDLLDRIPGMKYLYLPIDTETLPKRQRSMLRQVLTPDATDNGVIRICHAARNRKLKGSDYIESVVIGLKEKYDIEWVMIENMDHHQALQIKANCDICIDQLTDIGGWGYGASSVESLAMGIPTLTRINSQVADFLGEHPFVPVTRDSLRNELINLIENPKRRQEISEYSLQWVKDRHSIDAVMDTLYSYYSEVGLI